MIITIRLYRHYFTNNNIGITSLHYNKGIMIKIILIIILFSLAFIIPFWIGQWIDGESIFDLHLKPFQSYKE